MDTAWLIELKQSVSATPTWYGETDEGVLGMTTDHMKAIRFCRKWDAEMVLADIGWTEAFVCEHAWESFVGQPRPRIRRWLRTSNPLPSGVADPSGRRPQE